MFRHIQFKISGNVVTNVALTGGGSGNLKAVPKAHRRLADYDTAHGKDDVRAAFRNGTQIKA